MKAIIIIPARMESSRFPNKPLADINEKPMIVHVAERAKKANIGDVYVACAEKEIADVLEKNGYNAIITNPDHPSGTDRIFEATEKITDEDYDIIINIQGDLPTIEPHLIRLVLKSFDNKDVDISTLVCKISDKKEINNPNVVKAVVNWNNELPNVGNAINFSRDATIASDGNYYHHIGIYAYRKEALNKFVNFEPTKRELSEKLEQLRALDNDMRIDVVNVKTIPIGVDTREDLIKAEKFLKKQNIDAQIDT